MILGVPLFQETPILSQTWRASWGNEIELPNHMIVFLFRNSSTTFYSRYDIGIDLLGYISWDAKGYYPQLLGDPTEVMQRLQREVTDDYSKTIGDL